MRPGLIGGGNTSTGRLLKNHVKAVVVTADRLAASKVLSLRISRMGGEGYLVGFLGGMSVWERMDGLGGGLLTNDNPTRRLERMFLTMKEPKHVYFFVILQI